MAEKRMFAKSIVLSDAFLDMPVSARCLYFTLGMLADDDGFINNPKSIMRQCGATNDDLNILLLRKFLIPFESGIVVIKHWRINNYLRSDRYKETTYMDEKKQLNIEENGSYTTEDVGIPSIGIPSIDKDRLDKNRLDKNRTDKKNKQFVPPTLEDVQAYVKEKNLTVDPVQFYDYFTEGNWIDAKGQKVRSWKQKILTWEKYGKGKKEEKEDDFGNWGTTL